MREIDGYILLAEFSGGKGKYMHGPNKGKGMGSTENFRTNGMEPFNTLDDAHVAVSGLLERGDVISAEAKRIEMTVAENLEEMRAFEKMTALIAIQLAEYGNIFYGRYIEGALKNGYIPGADLETNGFQPFRNFETAMSSVAEIVRQGQSSARMATFKLSDPEPTA